MPILRMKEIREMDSDEKEEKLQEYRTELTKMKTMVKAGGSVENPGRAKALRKTIARILTVINEEEQ
ncbi:50S ribosomal protein L29 [Candidatus Bathyarchaeota archaeon]|nr:50S ribosomal protein L29 [Candidatus Bathyarchaeota archaeon]